AVVAGFGATGPGVKVAPDGRSILRMGWIAKVMAGHTLASMAADGTLKLVDPLDKYAPPGAKVPAFAGREITLLDLVTYTAGLPRELPDVPDPKPGENPFARFEADAYLRCRPPRALARCTLTSASACSVRRSRRPAASPMPLCSPSAWRRRWEWSTRRRNFLRHKCRAP